jgi:ribosomal-protein-alanine N-acetyltransferase
MKKLESFSTGRVTANPLRAEDLKELCLMHQDIEVMRYMGGARNEEESKRWLSDNLDHWNIHGFGCWMLTHRADGGFVGRSGLRRAQLDSGDEVELGYALVTQYWGKGLATEMAKAIVEIGFERLELESLIALVDAPNLASRKVAEKLGFHFERNTIWKSLPTMLYRLDHVQWTKTQRVFPKS